MKKVLYVADWYNGLRTVSAEVANKANSDVHNTSFILLTLSVIINHTLLHTTVIIQCTQNTIYTVRVNHHENVLFCSFLSFLLIIITICFFFI